MLAIAHPRASASSYLSSQSLSDSRCNLHATPRLKELKKENRQTKRGMGGGQGPHLHEQDFGRTIRGTGGALLILTRDTTGSQRGARWTPTSTGGLISV